MKNGIISLLLLGIVAVLLLLGIFIFGPWELSGFGQLSQRQGEQAASAAEIAFPGPDDADKQINIIDVNLLRQYYGKSCPYYFLGGSSAVHEVKLNWVPGLQLISKNAYTQIRYGDMTQAQTTECSDT